jgi:hypothetical protein
VISLDDFRRRVSKEMRALGKTPSVAEVDAAIARAVELGQPPGGSVEGLILQRGLAVMREREQQKATG